MNSIVIVGAGHSGMEVAAALRGRAYAGQIHLIGRESLPPYNRPTVSKELLHGDVAVNSLHLVQPDRFVGLALQYRPGEAAVAIDIGARTIRTDKRVIGYDALVFATGANVRPLAVPGASDPRVRYLRDHDDAVALRDALRPGCRLVMIGAGFIGLEAAAAGVRRGCDVTVVEAADRVMARAVAPAISRYFEKRHADAGVALRFGKVAALEVDDDHIAVVLADGTRLVADLIVVGIGVVPNDGIARDAGIECNDGIVVDAQMRTSAPNVYAVGDCALHPNPWADGRLIRLESVQNASDQAAICAANICGEAQSYDSVPTFWSDQYDIRLQMAGLPAADDVAIVVEGNDATPLAVVYHRIGRVTAGQVVNQPKLFQKMRRAIRTGADIATLQLAAIGTVRADAG